MKPDRTIWLFAAGYFAAYAPYSALIKLTTKRVTGLELLPGVIYGTVIAALVYLTILRWWRYVAPLPAAAGRGCREAAGEGSPSSGLRPPSPRMAGRRATLLSGLGTAAIIGTTTIAYTFHGISIIFALLLMRGGVLLLAPLVDLAFARRVRWFSWAALLLTFASLAIAFVTLDGKAFTLAAAINLAAYLSGYVVRLPAMTRLAKISDKDVTRAYFVRELLVALAALLVVPLGIALAGNGALRRGFALALPLEVIVASLTIGVLYASLYFFGTLIYLDRRENTFCVPLNRGASMLAGVVASFAMLTPPPAPQLVAAALILFALLLLSPLHHLAEHAVNVRAILRVRATMPEPVPLRMSRVLLFVCSGNTCRSAMAEAIGNAELAARMRLDIRAVSAGVTAKDGAPMPQQAMDALQAMAIPIATHSSRRLTPEIAEQADVIYCMTARHRDDVVSAIPAVAEKTRCLDPQGDIDDPIGKPLDVYVDCAKTMQRLIRERFDELGVIA